MNHLIIMADEYMARALGCANHPIVQTPNLDRLARRGVRFIQAYTPSPMCVPARASFQTGLHVHRLGCWSSAEPYDGEPRGWGHHLRENGSNVASIGKLHYKSSTADNGFDPEILPLHVSQSVGWIPGLFRKSPLPFDASGFANNIGGGGSEYSQYDGRICEQACQWLSNSSNTDIPWVLFVSLVSPHYPLRSPNQFFDLYDPDHVDMPFCYHESERPSHPVVRKIMAASGYDQHFDEQKIRLARAAYYGLCSYVDHLVGQLLQTLDDNDLTSDTRIIFTSDHGEMLGNHGAWTKMLMLEDSVSIPMLLSGPGIDEGIVSTTPVSLLDIAPMLYKDHHCPFPDHTLDGESLAELSKENPQNRNVLSQYHDGWSPTGFYMIRWENWKYIHYQDYDPELFDLENDPQERTNLADKKHYKQVLKAGHEKLGSWLDPEAVNRKAFSDQQKLIDQYGGVDGIKKKMELYFDYTPISSEAH